MSSFLGSTFQSVNSVSSEEQPGVSVPEENTVCSGTESGAGRPGPVTSGAPLVELSFCSVTVVGS